MDPQTAELLLEIGKTSPILLAAVVVVLMYIDSRKKDARNQGVIAEQVNLLELARQREEQYIKLIREATRALTANTDALKRFERKQR